MNKSNWSLIFERPKRGEKKRTREERKREEEEEEEEEEKKKRREEERKAKLRYGTNLGMDHMEFVWHSRKV